VFNGVGWAPSLSEQSPLLSVMSGQQRCSDDRPQLTRAKFTPEATSVLTLVPEWFLNGSLSFGTAWVCWSAGVLQHPSMFLSFAERNGKVEVRLGVGEGSPAGSIAKHLTIKTYCAVCETKTAYGISVIQSSQNYRLFRKEI